MNYFLKILGSTHMTENADAIEFFIRSGSNFWDRQSKILFSNTAAGQVRKGDILIQYIPKGFQNKAYAGRVVGCFKALTNISYQHFSEKFSDDETGVFDYYCIAERLFKKFSVKSKDSTIITVDKLGIKLGGQLQAGIQKISANDGERIVKYISQIESALC